MIISLLILLYVVSAVGMWIWTKLAHSKNGIFSTINTSFGDVLWTIIPIVNTVFCIFCWIGAFPIKINCNNFFNIKK